MLSRKLSMLLICLVFCLGLTGVASAAPEGEPHIISVDGYGEVKAVPDRANVDIGIVTNSRNAKEAQQENAAIANAVKNALLGLGVAEGDMKTVNYNFRPVYSTEKGKTNKVIGYTATCSLEVRVNDITKTGMVIDRALNNGANRVNNLYYDLKEPEKFRKEALRMALRDARAKAEIIAQELGTAISGIKLVTENVGRVANRNDRMMTKMAGASMMDAADAASPVIPVEVGDLEVGAVVHVDYIIQ